MFLSRPLGPPLTAASVWLSDLHTQQAGHFVREEGHQRHRGARLCHQEDSLQDGGRGRAEVAEAEVVSVLRRHHVHPLHGVIVRVRSGTVAEGACTSPIM